MFDFLIVFRQVSWMKKREQQHGAMVGVGAKNGKRSTRTVGQFFVVDFLSFYYKKHTYVLDGLL